MKARSPPATSGLARRLIETGNQIASGLECDGRSGEIISHGLGPPAQMPGEKHFEDGVERATILLSPESVALVRIVDVGYRNVARLHGADDLLGFRRLDPHVVGTLSDQQRAHDPLDMVERRALLQDPSA